MTSFAIATPSRGLIHSRTLWAVEANRREAVAAGHRDLGWYGTDDLPIPECHQVAAERALATGAEAILFVEEDVIPPAGALLALLDALQTYHVTAIDYPVWNATGHWSCVCRNQSDGAIRYCGLGCTLVRRELFERLDPPWFRSDMQFAIVRQGNTTEFVQKPVAYDYGGQDIYFAWRALEAGMTIGEVPMTAAHARVLELGKRETNHGYHTIQVIDTIERWQRI